MNKGNLPNHIAIIMDGNRRWAKQRGLNPQLGHKEGAKTVEKIVRYAKSIGIKYITAYAFSTENWKRTTDEVNAIMLLLKNYLDDYSKRADTENIKINILGDISKLSKDLQESLNKCMERTQNNTAITFNIALNYGGRDEIVHAVKNIVLEIKENKLELENINEQLINDKLYTAGQLDPDLVIRTGGELRLSNYLLWQSAYAELYFTDVYWPDFNENEFDKAIEEYQNRTRKFGGN